MDDHAPGSAPTPPMGGSALTETGDPALPLRGVLTLPSGVAMQELVGEQGGHLRVISRVLGVKVGQRGDQISVQGERAAVLLAQRVIGELYEVAAEGNALTAGDVPNELLWQRGRGHVPAFFLDGDAIRPAIDFLDRHLRR